MYQHHGLRASEEVVRGVNFIFENGHRLDADSCGGFGFKI